MALLPNAVLGIGAPRNRQPEPERTPGAVLGLPTVASPSPAPAPGPAPAPVVAQPQAVAPVQDGNWLMNWLTSMAQNPGQPLTGPPAPAPQAPVAVPVVQPQVVAAPVAPPVQQDTNWLFNWLQGLAQGATRDAAQAPVPAQTAPVTESRAYPVPATPVTESRAIPVPAAQPQPAATANVIPMPPVQNPNGPEMAQWLLNYGNSGGTIAAPVPATPTESRAYPIGKVGTDTKQTQPETKQSEPKGTPAESRAVPVGEDAAMFLMRPAGLSGPDGKREAPVKLTNYEGLADNAKAKRLTWEEYNALTPEEQDIADLNKLLVRSREADLTRDRKLKPAQMAQYTADVAAIFGPDGGSKVVAPKTVDLLKSIDFKGVGQDLDDFLSLNKGITVDEVKAGNLVDKGLVDSVQATAETAFAKPDQQYWNLNSAVRGITPEEAKKKNLPGGFGLEVRKVNEPEKDAQGNIRWTQDRVYNEVWNGLKSGREEYNPKKLKEFFKFLEFDEKDFKELRDNIHLRAMNEKLYGTAPAAAQSVDGKQVTERTGEEVLQFLEGLM